MFITDMDELTIQSLQSYVAFRWGNGDFAVHPHGALIAIADESDRISFKLLASRKTVYSVKNSLLSPSLETPDATVEMLNALL